MINTYFKSTLMFAIGALTLAFIIGGWQGLILAAILAVLEVSLSFDNAIVNAKELEHMDDKWRHRFLTWGMLIAVFGMRILFPLLVVGVATDSSPIAALNMAIFEPDQYKNALTSAHVSVMGFGGTFLFMVFLTFFLDESKTFHWLEIVESHMSKLGKLDAIEFSITLILAVLVSQYLKLTHGIEESSSFLLSSMLGLITYFIVDILRSIIGEDHTNNIIKSGAASFLYLEVLDASFSFDGVIGAFAITNSLFIIAIGLGIGAFAVRSMTIMLVEKGTLNEYQYLEHSAFWSIGCLATIMYINTFQEIPEVLTGLLSASIILAGFLHSLISNNNDSKISSDV